MSSNSIAVVTGAGSGIGKSIALAFAAHGLGEHNFAGGHVRASDSAQPPAASGLFVKIATASAAAVGSSVHRNNSDGGLWSIAAACKSACSAERVLPSQNPPPSTPPEVVAFEAVLNGTVNFMLERLGEGAAFAEALADARAAGLDAATPVHCGHDADARPERSPSMRPWAACRASPSPWA